MAENHHWSLLTDSSTKLLKTEFRTSKRKKKKKKTQKLKKMFTILITSLTYFEIMSNTHVTHYFLTLIVIQRFSFFHQMNSHYLKTLSSMLQSKAEGLKNLCLHLVLAAVQRSSVDYSHFSKNLNKCHCNAGLK